MKTTPDKTLLPGAFIRLMADVIAIIYLIIVLWFTIGAINETILRGETAKLIQAKRVTLTQQRVDAMRREMNKNPALQSEKSSGTNDGASGLTSGRMSETSREKLPTEGEIARELEELDILETRLAEINLNGGTGKFHASNLIENLISLQGLIEIEDEKQPITKPLWELALFMPMVLPSEGLLAVLLLGSGVLGALIAKIRKEEVTTLNNVISLQPFLVGSSAGFICFLLLRGGKSVFLMDYASQTQHINPYSAAFTALLAGLFTDRAYKILSMAVDALGAKIEEVLKSPAKSDGHLVAVPSSDAESRHPKLEGSSPTKPDLEPENTESQQPTGSTDAVEPSQPQKQ